MSITWSLKKFPVKKLKELEKNPRILSEHDYNHLKKSLDKFGLIDKPIVTKEGLIIAGHQRKRILEEQGLESVECWVPSRDLTDQEIEELNIRHNKNSGEWDFDILANQWEMTDLIEYGFTTDELDFDIDDALNANEDAASEIEEEDKTMCSKCKRPFE